MKENKYISLTHKKLTGEITPEELSMLSSLEASDAQIQTIEAIWEASESYEPSVSFDGGQAFNKFLENIADEPRNISANAKSKKRSFTGLVVALGLSLLFIGAYFTYQHLSTPTMHYAETELKTVEMPDGSEIYLAPGASIEYAGGFGDEHRDLDLKGKAYFDVQRNPDLQFNIHMEDSQISVLGTAFNLDFDGSNVVLEVNEGTVRYSNEDDELIVKATEKLSYDKSTDKITSGKVVNPMAFTWATDELSFKNASLNKVFETLEEYFKVDFIIADTAVQSATECKFTWPSIKKPVLNEILEILAETHALDYKFSPDGKTIDIVNINCK